MHDNWYSKMICFKRGRGGLYALKYKPGAHSYKTLPVNPPQSSKCYVLKHMNSLGLQYFVNKHQARFVQSANPRNRHHSGHYVKGPTNAVLTYNYVSRVATNWTYATSPDGKLRLQCS